MSDLSQVISMLKDMNARLGRVEAKLGGAGGGAAAVSTATAAPASVGGMLGDYDAWHTSAMKPINEAAVKLRENGFKSAKKCANFINKGCKGIRIILEASTKCKKPSDADFLKLMQDNVWSLTSEGKRVRTRKLGANYEKALSETMDLFKWPTMSGEIGPCAFVQSTLGSVEFYGNRARTQYKKTEHGALHMQYLNGVRDLINSLKKFILIAGFKNQLKWTGSGDVSQFSSSGGSAAAAKPAAASKKEEPKAAAPKKEEKKAATTSAATGGAADMGALFAALNKGGAITKGMKKVTDDMKVHKNTKLRGHKKIPAKATKPKKKKTAAKKKLPPPKMEFVRGQQMWYVENQIDGSTSKVDFAKFTQAAYLYKCQKGSVVELNGKGKSLQVVACDGVLIRFDDLVAGVELTNCKNITLVSRKTCKMFNFDQVDSCKTFICQRSGIDDIVFACNKCSDLNCDFPDPDSKDESITRPIPTTFEHKVAGRKIHSEVSHLYG